MEVVVVRKCECGSTKVDRYRFLGVGDKPMEDRYCKKCGTLIGTFRIRRKGRSN